MFNLEQTTAILEHKFGIQCPIFDFLNEMRLLELQTILNQAMELQPVNLFLR